MITANEVVLGRGYIIACQPKLRPTRSVLDSGRPLRLPTTSWSITYLESNMALACLWLFFDLSYAFCSRVFVELEWTTSAKAECRPRDVGLGRTKTFEEPTTDSYTVNTASTTTTTVTITTISSAPRHIEQLQTSKRACLTTLTAGLNAA